ncbi:uncharacterized protein LOC134821600 [Bolinopsis microptera]|uniref:uncharacterized protein LOC134821600 n=1 Tax=Bolinopsis microptera TaxID=2820187 RepID=UPI0030794009
MFSVADIFCRWVYGLERYFTELQERALKGLSDVCPRVLLLQCTECLQYCLDIGMLRPFQTCEECNNFMTLKKCPTSKYTDGYCWQCSDTSSDIDHFCSVRTGSILHKRKLPFSVFLHIIWLFCNRLSVCDVARIITISTGCVRSIFSSIRNCMLEDLFDNGARRKIGGVGCTVEVDESKFGKRKYNRGRRVVGKWVLGGFCRTTGECFLVECTGNRRDHNTLITLIKEHVLPGTTILTDKWKGYNALQHHGFPHQVVKIEDLWTRSLVFTPTAAKGCGSTLRTT